MARQLERCSRDRPQATLCRIGAAGAAVLTVSAAPLSPQLEAGRALQDALAPLHDADVRRRTEQARLLSVLQAYGRDPPPALLVSPRSALDAARATILARALLPELERRAEVWRREAEAAATLRLLPPVPGSPRRAGPGLRYPRRAGEVVSPLSGRVDFAGPLRGWGGVVILSGPGGRHVVLAGLDAVVEPVGRPVAAGEPVGRTGGSSELYLEVRRLGEPIDPVRLLQRTAG